MLAVVAANNPVKLLHDVKEVPRKRDFFSRALIRFQLVSFHGRTVMAAGHPGHAGQHVALFNWYAADLCWLMEHAEWVPNTPPLP